MFWNKKIEVNTNEKEILELVTRGVEEVIVKDSVLSKLQSGKRLRIKFGIDPTSPDLHLGHAVVLRKLKAFQVLGHQIVLIIGDFTATIGDPSGKDKTRPPLSPKDIKKNFKNYLKHASKIINIKQTEVHYNSKWLTKLYGHKLFNILSQVSINQILEREDFHNRYINQNSIRMYELLYPVMQAYDSIAIKADIELGGTDQTFNLLMGRFLMEKNGLVPQDVLTTPIIEGLDGRKKMSKSLNNYIALDDDQNDMYGKVMALRDELIPKYFLLATDVAEGYIKEVEEKLKSGENPKELKMELAREIVKIYHGEKESLKAQANFTSVFSKGFVPEDVKMISVQSGILLRDTLVDTQFVESKSEFTRLVQAGGIQDMGTGEKISDPQYKLMETKVFRIGKKRFVKIEIK